LLEVVQIGNNEKDICTSFCGGILMTLDISEAKVERNEFGLWLSWTLATGLGMLLGLLPFVLFIDDLDLLLARILVPLVAGFLVGTFQWLVLRPFLTHSVDWILNGGAGWALGYALGLVIIQALVDVPFGALLGYLLFGLIISVLQWPVLRREIPNAIPWVLASILGWALGAYLSQAILNLIVNTETTSQILSSAVLSGLTGLIAGAITGLALIWIVRKPEAEEPALQE
jgi:hypothetical protein